MKFHRTTFPLIALAVGTAGIAVAQAQGPYQQPQIHRFLRGYPTPRGL